MPKSLLRCFVVRTEYFLGLLAQPGLLTEGAGEAVLTYPWSILVAGPGSQATFIEEWLQGDSTDALLEPFTIVLTESMARKYFGAEDPMGQTLLVENEYSAKVTGVIRNLPENTQYLYYMVHNLEQLKRHLALADQTMADQQHHHQDLPLTLKDIQWTMK